MGFSGEATLPTNPNENNFEKQDRLKYDKELLVFLKVLKSLEMQSNIPNDFL